MTNREGPPNVKALKYEEEKKEISLTLEEETCNQPAIKFTQ